MHTSLSRFLELWVHPHYSATPMSFEQIEAAEVALDSRFPSDYKFALQQAGAFSTTIEMLDEIVDGDHDVHCLDELYSPENVVDQTINWRKMGLPQNLIAIGDDQSGNKFCIQASRSGAKPNSNIYFWDQDFDHVEKIASSLNEWVEAYNKLAD